MNCQRFSDVQIQLMKESVNKPDAKNSVIWKSAFLFYNLTNQAALSMHIPKSYPKVLEYIIANNSKETVNIEQ